MYHTFDIVRLKIQAGEGGALKERPAMVLSNPEYSNNSGLVICAVITTSTSNKFSLDMPLDDYYEMGLPQKCFVRPEKIFSIDKSMIVRKEGELLFNLRPELSKRLNKVIPLNFSLEAQAKLSVVR